MIKVPANQPVLFMDVNIYTFCATSDAFLGIINSSVTIFFLLRKYFRYPA